MMHHAKTPNGGTQGRKAAFACGRWLCAVFAAQAVVGCGPQAKLDVTQPTQPPPMNQLKLESRWAYFDAGERDRYLLSFPLPGAVSGDRVFFVYVDAAPGMKTQSFTPGTSAGAPDAAAAGFFLQMRGHNAGLAKLKEGKWSAAPVALSGDRQRRIEIWGECEDGTVIAGQATAVHAPLDVRDFVEDSHPVEVKALYAPSEALAKDTTFP